MLRTEEHIKYMYDNNVLVKKKGVTSQTLELHNLEYNYEEVQKYFTINYIIRKVQDGKTTLFKESFRNCKYGDFTSKEYDSKAAKHNEVT